MKTNKLSLLDQKDIKMFESYILHKLGLYESWIISISSTRQNITLNLGSYQHNSKWWLNYGKLFQTKKVSSSN